MKEDHAGRTHRDTARRSDKVNAPENQNREFQDGYRTGVESLGDDASKVIEPLGIRKQHKCGKYFGETLDAG
jgi:hypothetical protein